MIPGGERYREIRRGMDAKGDGIGHVLYARPFCVKPALLHSLVTNRQMAPFCQREGPHDDTTNLTWCER
jgi:hypothetical protein